MRTWRWRLRTGGLTPRVNPDGSSPSTTDGLADVALERARILTLAGHDITPDGVSGRRSRAEAAGG